MGRKVGDEGAVDRRIHEHPPKNNSGTPNDDKAGEKTPSRLMRFVDLIFVHFPW